MGFFDRFEIKDSKVRVSKDTILSIPVNTTIVKDNGTTYSKNSKGAWEKVAAMDTSVIETAVADTYSKSEADAKYMSVGGGAISGNMVVDGTLSVTELVETSAKKYKENIEKIDNGLEIVSQLQGVTYNWKETGKADIGFIADDINEILPQLVKVENGEIEGMNYGKITAVLVEAIKELHQVVADQQIQINILKNK